MSDFNLAAPAPEVGSAVAEKAPNSESVRVEPAKPSEAADVLPVTNVEPAVTVDDPKKFAPKSVEEPISHLSVSELRKSGSDFESMVRRKTR